MSIVIVGPTASGKSDLALRLAKFVQSKQFKKWGISGGEIISADSRQIYRGMDIGTGKIRQDRHKGRLCINAKTPFVSGKIRHHLIDVTSPKKVFTVDNFKCLGEIAINEIRSRGEIPIIVGGTGFYIDVLLGRISVAPVPPNPKLRARFNKFTAEKLFEKLIKLDPERAESIDRYNKHRLIRALEIIKAIGKVPLKLMTSQVINLSGIIWIGLNPENLKERIKKRLDVRLKQGMVEEVEKLHKKRVSWKRLDNFGLEYRWISRYLKSKNGLRLKFKYSEEYKNLLRDIIRYSKRQMTWFKRNKEIQWVKNLKEAMTIIRKELR